MNISANNLAYWLTHDIDRKTWWTLHWLAIGHHPGQVRRFQIAYLIAMECIDSDLKVTEKGRECLDYFRSDYSPGSTE